jgi:hypothetical protein
LPGCYLCGEKKYPLVFNLVRIEDDRTFFLVCPWCAWLDGHVAACREKFLREKVASLKGEGDAIGPSKPA